MAETTDRAQDTESGTVAPSGEVYRPLSLLALAGFGVAVLYSVVVLAGGAVSLYNRVPWLMPGWSFAVPVVALALCVLAWARIRNAEGTLSGLAFTSWGLRLTVVVALSYAAYYTFTFFAVRLQAMDCAEQFFEQVKQGKLAHAFLLGEGVSLRDIDNSTARDDLEGRFNSARGAPGAPGPFTQFSRSQMIRGIQSAGEQTDVVPLGVVHWDYEKGGYNVKIKYRVVSPETEFEMIVDTFGRDSQPGEPKGRIWQVRLRNSDTAVKQGSLKQTALGEERSAAATMAQAFARAWVDKVNRRKWDEVYLDTLPPDERAALRKGQAAERLRQAAAVAGPAALGLPEPDRDALQAGRRAIEEGKLIRLDDKTFWAPKRDRAVISRTVCETFRPKEGGDPRFHLRLALAAAPLSRTQEGRLTFLLDVDLTYSDERTGFTTYLAEGFLIVSADEGRARFSPSAWRIDGIEARSGRKPPEMPRAPRGPGQPGAGP